MIKEIRNKIFGNPFGNHFLSKFNLNFKDEDAFMVFYSDRVMCVNLAHLLDLDVKVENEKITITGENGEQSELLFYFHEPFKGDETNFIRFNADLEALLKTSEFLVREAKQKFGDDAKKIVDLSTLHDFVVNEIYYYSSKDQFFADTASKMLSGIYNEIWMSRQNNRILDQDITLRASALYLDFFNYQCSKKDEFFGDISHKSQIRAINKILKEEFNEPIKLREYELWVTRGREPRGYNKGHFWNCVQTRRAIEKAKQEGYEIF